MKILTTFSSRISGWVGFSRNSFTGRNLLCYALVRQERKNPFVPAYRLALVLATS
ncbi:MAG: hypothetical protein Q8N38_07615 [Bacteroidales bacterium]|nr:hypothetical protein [Bacteroidales bacterium]